MERSKLPVPRAQVSGVTDLQVPSTKKLCPQKPAPLDGRDPNITFSSAPPNVVFKAGSNGKKTVCKKTGPAVRGPMTRYRMESELKERNQLLEAENSTLHDSVNSAQNTIHEMSEQQETLKEENKELKRHLEKHMIILESLNIDPASGEKMVAAAEEASKLREETRTVRNNLLKELKNSAEATKEQQKLLQTVKAKWDEAEERRRQFHQGQEAFQSDLDKFQLSLKDMANTLGL